MSKNNDYALNIPLYGFQTKQCRLIRFLHGMLIGYKDQFVVAFNKICGDFFLIPGDCSAFKHSTYDFKHVITLSKLMLRSW